MLNCKINGTVHIFFFLKSIAQPPVNETAPIFFSRGVFPSYYHVISDFCHIWGPFMAKIEKMCQKSAFLVVPSQNHWKWPTFTTIVQAPWSKKSYFSDFSSTKNILRSAGKIRKVWFFAPGCLNNCGQGWSFSVILAWDNQKGTFLTHFVNFGHEGAPNVTKLTYNMKILWENSHRKKIGAVSFTGGWDMIF